MSWFSEQIKQRTENDQNVVEDSFFSLAGVIMDKWDVGRQEDKRLIAKGALDEILKRLRFKPVEIPDEIQDA